MFSIMYLEDQYLELDFEKTMEHIVASIQTVGFDPYSQLYGHLTTGDVSYITRTDDARNLIKALDRNQIRIFVDKLSAPRH